MCEHITEHALVEGIVRTAGQWKKQQRRLWLKQRLPARSQGASPLLSSNSTRSVSVVSTSPVTPSEYILEHPEGIWIWKQSLIGNQRHFLDPLVFFSLELVFFLNSYICISCLEYFWCQQFWEISEMEIFLTEWSFPLQTPGRQVKPDLRLLESLECVITSGQLGLKFSLMDNSIVPNRHNSWSPRQTRRHIGNCEDSVSDNRGGHIWLRRRLKQGPDITEIHRTRTQHNEL